MTGPPDPTTATDPTTTTGPTPAAGAAPLAGAPAGTEPTPADLLRSVPPGTRVVARHRVPGGFTDALGYLRSCNGAECEIDTRGGPVTVVLANVVAAKRVPEPPPRRPGRSG